MAKKDKSAPTKSKTWELLQQSKIELCYQTVVTKSEVKACVEDGKANGTDVQYKICCAVHLEKATSFYRSLKYYVGQSLSKTNEKLIENIQDLATKEAALQTKFKDLTSKIKDAKENMKAAVEAACGLGRCIEEEKRCNPDIYHLLTMNIPDFEEMIQSINDDTALSYNKLNKVFDAAVDISGILSFGDIASLSTLLAAIKDKASEFSNNLETNIEAINIQVAEAHLNLSTSIDSQHEQKVDCCMIKATNNATEQIYAFVCKPCCKTKDANRIREICRELTEGLPDSKEEQSICAEKHSYPSSNSVLTTA